jgi:hypothetical protein
MNAVSSLLILFLVGDGVFRAYFLKGTMESIEQAAIV